MITDFGDFSLPRTSENDPSQFSSNPSSQSTKIPSSRDVSPNQGGITILGYAMPHDKPIRKRSRGVNFHTKKPKRNSTPLRPRNPITVPKSAPCKSKTHRRSSRFFDISSTKFERRVRRTCSSPTINIDNRSDFSKKQTPIPKQSSNQSQDNQELIPLKTVIARVVRYQQKMTNLCSRGGRILRENESIRGKIKCLKRGEIPVFSPEEEKALRVYEHYISKITQMNSEYESKYQRMIRKQIDLRRKMTIMKGQCRFYERENERLADSLCDKNLRYENLKCVMAYDPEIPAVVVEVKSHQEDTVVGNREEKTKRIHECLGEMKTLNKVAREAVTNSQTAFQCIDLEKEFRRVSPIIVQKFSGFTYGRVFSDFAQSSPFLDAVRARNNYPAKEGVCELKQMFGWRKVYCVLSFAKNSVIIYETDEKKIVRIVKTMERCKCEKRKNKKRELNLAFPCYSDCITLRFADDDERDSWNEYGKLFSNK